MILAADASSDLVAFLCAGNGKPLAGNVLLPHYRTTKLAGTFIPLVFFLDRLLLKKLLDGEVKNGASGYVVYWSMGRSSA